MFEIIIQRRMDIVEEILDQTDIYNNGFLKGSRTAANTFILHSMIERQLIMKQNLFVIYVDFSRAFDLMDRNILFYKLITSGTNGRVLNTLRDLYSKTKF